jgi:hypothetical protein
MQKDSIGSVEALLVSIGTVTKTKPLPSICGILLPGALPVPRSTPVVSS